uniref:ARAD1B14234p n=1 Tax=Blastobotrys adeninivorans TaxID=409370 RepID=A0A060T692_BLAAD
MTYDSNPNTNTNRDPRASSGETLNVLTNKFEAVTCASPHSGNTSSDESSQPQTPRSEPVPVFRLSIDLLCSRPVFNQLIKTYLDKLYPITPIVHRPSFAKDLDAGRETRDPAWFLMAISICAYTLAAIPRVFSEIQSLDPDLPYRNSKQMFMQCYDIVNAGKRTHWISSTSVSANHFIATYLMAISEHLIQGDHVRGSVALQESIGTIKALKGHLWPAGYERLNNIEQEILKRCLWIAYMSSVTEAMWSPDLNFQAPNATLFFDHVQERMPAALDDEYITESGNLPQSPGTVSLLTGFIDRIQIHLATECPAIPKSELLSDLADVDVPSLPRGAEELIAEANRCKILLDRIKNVPVKVQVGPWVAFTHRGSNPDDNENLWYRDNRYVRSEQLAAQRAETIITKSWLQSTILEHYREVRSQLESLMSDKHSAKPIARAPPSPPNDRHLVSAKLGLGLNTHQYKQSIMDELLSKLSHAPLESMDPNAGILLIKLRIISFSLMEQSTLGLGDSKRTGKQLRNYLNEIMKIISDLDRHRSPETGPKGASSFPVRGSVSARRLS